MAINFDALPTEKPKGSAGGLKPKGFYLGTIKEAVFNPAQDGKQENIRIIWDMEAKGDIDSWTFWDWYHYNSAKEEPRYKFARLLMAINLNLSGSSIEPKDLVKVLPGKRAVLDIGIDKAEKYNIVDIFSNDCIYPVSEWAALTGSVLEDKGTNVVPADFTEIPEDDDLPFKMDAPDGQKNDNEEARLHPKIRWTTIELLCSFLRSQFLWLRGSCLLSFCPSHSRR